MILGRQLRQLAAVLDPDLVHPLDEFEGPRLVERIRGQRLIQDRLLEVGSELVEPHLADEAAAADQRFPGLQHVLGDALVLEGNEDRDAGLVAVDGLLLNRRHHLGKRHRHAGRAEPAQGFDLQLAAKDPELAALEIRELTDRRRGGVVRRRVAGQADELEALGIADGPERLLERRIVHGAETVHEIVEYAGSRQHRIARIHPGQERRRRHRHLDGA